MTSFAKRHWFGVYHASMSDDGKARNQHAFKFGQMRVIIATSAFGLGVNVPDISSVLLYGCPADGLMYSQLSGRRYRKAQLQSVCQLLYDKREVTEADCHMQTACSEEVCLRDLLVKHILESPETLTLINAALCALMVLFQLFMLFILHLHEDCL